MNQKELTKLLEKGAKVIKSEDAKPPLKLILLNNGVKEDYILVYEEQRIEKEKQGKKREKQYENTEHFAWDEEYKKGLNKWEEKHPRKFPNVDKELRKLGVSEGNIYVNETRHLGSDDVIIDIFYFYVPKTSSERKILKEINERKSKWWLFWK